jgi:hypothetical protein
MIELSPLFLICFVDDLVVEGKSQEHQAMLIECSPCWKNISFMK